MNRRWLALLAAFGATLLIGACAAPTPAETSVTGP